MLYPFIYKNVTKRKINEALELCFPLNIIFQNQILTIKYRIRI